MKRYFSRVFRYWKALGHLIGLVMTPVHMFIVYFLVFGPAGLGSRLLGRDPLDRRIQKAQTFWKRKEIDSPTLENLRHTF